LFSQNLKQEHTVVTYVLVGPTVLCVLKYHNQSTTPPVVVALLHNSSGKTVAAAIYYSKQVTNHEEQSASVRVVHAVSKLASGMLWCEVSKLCPPYVRMPLGAVASQLTSSARMRKQTRNGRRVFGVPSQISSGVEHAVAYAVEPARKDRLNGVGAEKGSISGPAGAPPTPPPRPAPSLLALS
jgi:hypothetical protein